ncbi:hypothetical protein D3C72_1421340 [compost metagenome]
MGRRFKRRAEEIVFLQAGLLEILVGNLAQHLFLQGERRTRQVVGHDIRPLPDGRGGPHLGIEGNAPFQRRPLDLDIRVLLVEGIDQRLHAHAVTAGQKVPPDDILFGQRRQGGQTQNRANKQCLDQSHRSLLPFMWKHPLKRRSAASKDASSRLSQPFAIRVENQNMVGRGAQRHGPAVQTFARTLPLHDDFLA